MVRGSAEGSEVGVEAVLGFGVTGYEDEVVGARERKPAGPGMRRDEDMFGGMMTGELLGIEFG